MATLKDVAKLAGVSTTTVSIVLNGKVGSNRVSMKTQEKILDAVRTLNYKPNLSARKLKTTLPHQFTLAIYWPRNARKNYLANVIGFIDVALKRLNFKCELIIKFYERGALNLEGGLSNTSLFDAAIIGALTNEDMDFLAKFKPAIPVVLFNRKVSGYPSVVNVSEEAFDFIIQKSRSMAISHISIFKSNDPYLATRDRMQKFIEKCSQNQYQLSHFTNTSNFEGGYQLGQEWLALNKPSTFIFCETENIAIGAIKALLEHNVKIPEDVRIAAISYSEIDYTQFITPNLTVAQLPTEKMANAIVKMLYQHLMHGTEMNEVQTFELELLERASF